MSPEAIASVSHPAGALDEANATERCSVANLLLLSCRDWVGCARSLGLGRSDKSGYTNKGDITCIARLEKVTMAVTAATIAALALTGIAGAAAPSHSGTIKYLAVQINNDKPVDIVTGAVSDHGTDRSVSNTTQKIVLSKGTFEVDATKFNKSFKFTTDPKGCTAVGTASATNLPISHGTGAYAAITGSISVKVNILETGVIKNGKCQNLNNTSSAEVSSFSGTGHVSY
jgi:hypothetical protein